MNPLRLSLFGVLSLLLVVQAAPVSAQQPAGVVSGTVVEAAGGEAIPAASAALWADSSLVTGAMADRNGAFRIENVPAGQYELRVSFVGYETKRIPDVTVGPGSREVALGEIALAESATELDEVQVTAEREYMEVTAEKTVYNTGEQPVTAGGSARDVLETIPSVEVDVNGQISLRGSQNVAVHLNGKPAPMSGEALTSFLEGLNAEDIERVEVIPNPSARYEPEGMSGILNIVLAKDKERGWGGGVSASAGTRGNYNASANAHYGSGPWSLFANYSARYGDRERSGFRFRENRFLDPTTYLEEETDGEGGGLSNTFNTDISYQLSEKNALTWASVFSLRERDSDELTRYALMDAQQDLTRRYERETEGTSSDFSMDQRLSFTRTWKPRQHELSAEARFEMDREDETEDYFQRALPLEGEESEGLTDRQRVEQDEQERELSLQADYRRPLALFTESGHLEAGYKGDFEWQESSSYSESAEGTGGVLPPDPELTPDEELNNTFDYRQQTHALYGILGAEAGALGMQAGVRLEQAFTTFELTQVPSTFDPEEAGTAFEHDYFSIFPSAHLTYSPTERDRLKASYSKRVRRPSTWQLSPIGDYDDPTFRRVGNPYLDPEYTHAFEVGYTRLGDAYTLTLSPYYRLTTNAISWNESLEEGGVTIVTFENFETERSYGAELIGSLSMSDWLKGNASLNAYKQVTDGSNLASELSADALGFRTRLSATASLPQGWTLQLSQFYRSPMDVPGGRIEAFTRTDLALQKELLDGRASISLRGSDVFDQMGFEVERDLEAYYQTYRRDFNAQGVQLSLRYSFGQRDERRRDRGPRGDGGAEEGGGIYGGG